jgi:hypothetical protein
MSQNSPDSSTNNNSKNIPKVVGDHADRLMDSLFADIEDLLSGDSHPQAKSSQTVVGQQPAPESHPEHQPTGPSLRPSAAYHSPALESNTAINKPPQQGNWKKILLGLSLVAIAASAGIWWLAKERKINLDALLPSDASKADIQFADYLHRSLGKIDGGAEQSPPTNQSTQSTLPSAPVTNPSSVITSAAPAAPVPMAASSFTKVIKSQPPTAEFVIDGKIQQLNVGDKIGKSGWTLGTVTGALDTEVIIKRNGELRTLKAGQQF